MFKQLSNPRLFKVVLYGFVCVGFFMWLHDWAVDVLEGTIGLVSIGREG